MTGAVLAGTVRSSPDRATHGERQGMETEGAESVKTGASFHQGLPGGRELLGEVILAPHRYHRDISCLPALVDPVSSRGGRGRVKAYWGGGNPAEGESLWGGNACSPSIWRMKRPRSQHR